MSAGYRSALFPKMCRGSLKTRALEGSEKDPLMALADWGVVKEAEALNESLPLAKIPLEIATMSKIALAVHRPLC